MSDELTPSSDLFTDVRCILADARRAAYTAVNSAMVAAYWQIGRRIVEEELGGSAKSTYGDRLLPELSRALTAEFGKGFSYANLRNFRQFYLTYPDPEICYTLRSKLSRTHHRLIMRVESHSAREYYLTHAERENWSTRTLERQIETRSYQRPISTQRYSLRNGDVLFNTRNSVELVGKTGHVVSESATPLVSNNNLMRLRFVDSALPAFVALQMCSKQFRERMEGGKRATISIGAVYGKDLRPLPIALPPLAEQHQIVAEVEARTTAIDHLETELDRQITRSNRLRQSTLASAFSGKLS